MGLWKITVETEKLISMILETLYYSERDPQKKTCLKMDSGFTIQKIKISFWDI